jgi:hypothetical protein
MVTPEQDGRQLRGQQRPRGLRERADRQRHRLHHRHCADAPSGVRAGNEARSVSRMSRTGRGPAVPAATSLPQVMNCWPSRMTLSAVMAAGDEPHGRLAAAAGAPITDGHAQTAILPQPAGQAKPQLSVPAPSFEAVQARRFRGPLSPPLALPLTRDASLQLTGRADFWHPTGRPAPAPPACCCPAPEALPHIVELTSSGRSPSRYTPRAEVHLRYICALTSRYAGW